ncbi:MAG TPA: hypothetical protein VHJ78_02135 [Actinomycetota bacterium]|nr:hypothetical protein [Actinomycetota bacterium]
MGLFPLAAALVSGVFSLSLFRQFLDRRRPHQLAWGTALAAFAAASLFASIGMFAGWSPALFRSYYLFGALVNVPILALGTAYLYLPRRVAHLAALAVAAASLYGALAVFGGGMNADALLASEGIPMGRDVMPEGVRALSRYYSYTGFLVVLAGAIWSAARLARRPGERSRRLAQGNALIAAGTVVVAIASAFARQGQGSVFAVGLAAGVSVMYAGFLRTSAQAGTKQAAEPAEPAGRSRAVT